VVLAEAHAVGVTGLDEGDDEVGLPVVGNEHLDADAVEPHERPALGDRDVAGGVACLALVAETDGRRPGNRPALMRAARLFGAAQALAETSANQSTFFDRVEFQRSVDALRAALGEEVFTAAWAEGRAMTVEQAIAYALAD